MNYPNYSEGLEMHQFKHIEAISSYNYNYYVGFDKDLLFGSSDDDDTTEWFLVKNENFVYLGESSTMQGDKLHRSITRNT